MFGKKKQEIQKDILFLRKVKVKKEFYWPR